MTDDRKPRQFYIADDCDNGLHVEDKPTEGFDIKVIELEPTLQLIEEMSEALRFYLEIKPITDDGAHAFLALEEYRKFLEGVEK